MVVLRNTGGTMYKCRVLYIGSCPPIETLRGTEALQGPLQQRYPSNMEDVEGIDAQIQVLPDALEMTYTTSGQVVQFPLSRLTICAAMRAVTALNGVTGETTRSFVPVNTVEADTRHPAIFAAIVRRSQGREIPECHAFICNSTRDALHLVNSTATANMACKQQRGQLLSTDSNRYENGINVVHNSHQNDYDTVNDGVQTIVINGGQSGESYQQQTYPTIAANEPIIIKTQVDQSDRVDYIEQETVRQPEAKQQTYYIKFDKTNLTPTNNGANNSTLRVQSNGTAYSGYTQPQPKHVVVQSPRYVTVPPPPPPQPMMMYRQPVPRPMPAPPMMYAPQPRPVYLRPPPKQPMMMMVRPPPPQPMMMRHPPPQSMMMVRPPPPQPRMYQRRVMSPPARYMAQAPVHHRRARSSSPHGYTRSDNRSRLTSATSKPKYQPKWGAVSDIADNRMSRRDYSYVDMPRDFRQDENMFMNEKAFGRRINGDNRISHMSSPYHYPTAYEMNDSMFLTRPTTKSNPKYSSSSSDSGSEIRRDKRFSR